MEGINFGWLAVWISSPDKLRRKSDFVRRLSDAAAPGRGDCGPCPDFASYTLAFALQLRKITENLSQYCVKLKFAEVRTSPPISFSALNYE